MRFKEYMDIRNKDTKSTSGRITKYEIYLFGVELTKGWLKRDFEIPEEKIALAVKHVLSSKLVLQKVKDNLKPLYMPNNEGMDQQFVYLMENQVGMLKIGISKDPVKRARVLETSSGLTVNLICFWAVNLPARTLESKLHKIFSKQRLGGEWFQADSFSQEEIEENFGCDFLKYAI